MTNLYIDTEFNEFGGELISMALVTGTGFEFYEVLECPNPGPWVKENVIPILGKEPVSKEVFQDKLFNFLMHFEEITIIARIGIIKYHMIFPKECYKSLITTFYQSCRSAQH